MRKTVCLHKKFTTFFCILFCLFTSSNFSWGQISENFSTWTSKTTYTAALSQSGSGGTWTAIAGAVIVAPTAAANGTGSIGSVQISGSATPYSLILPNIISGGVGKITIKARATSASNSSFSVEKNVNGGGVDNGNII